MRIAITGHRGLIGTTLKAKLLEEGHEVVLEMDNRDGMPIDALENISDMIGQIDMFIHMADFCKINKCVRYPSLGHINGINAYRVMEFCRKNKVPKVIYLSSSRVLSSEKNPYTAGKTYGEELCKAYHDCYGIDYLIIRPSTVYGPFNDLTGRVIDIFFRSALNNRDIIIYGDPETKTLDFTHVNDFTDAMMLAIAYSWNTDYNISGGEEVKVYDLAKMIIEKTGSNSKIILKSAETAQPQKIHLNIEKLKKIGYSPKINLEKGISECVEFYKDLLKK
jgi:nucleoside-diphosphate-sugar epimerase